MNAATMRLLDELREHGFTPDDGGEWFDLAVRGSRMVRAVLDDGEVTVHAMSANGIVFWSVRLSSGTPLGVITSVIAQAATRERVTS